jgi:hypothetical protein
MAGRKIPFDIRFRAKVRKTDACWLWTGSVVAEGYGVLWKDGKNVRAHRISWELHYGPIPDGMKVCHKCDNPPCVNPSHLFLGTNRDNTQDSISKGRYKSNWPGYGGSDHPMAILTEDAVAHIRATYKKGVVSMKSFADRFGVSIGTIAAVVHGRTWPGIQPNHLALNSL